MTKRPITVGPDESVVHAAKIIADHNFNGLPVVDNNNKVIGILTEYDLVSKGSDMHLPTLISVLSNIDVYKKDSGVIKDDLKKLLLLKVRDIMNPEPLCINENKSVHELADLFAHHHRVNPIPVIDGNGILVGIVSRYDLVRMFVDDSINGSAGVVEQSISDKKVDRFIKDFENRFVFVSKTRLRFWPILSVAFAIVGFFIAFAIIVNIAIK